MNLYISDLHFGHKNVIRFDHRPFCDIDEMDHSLIKLWNSRVQPDDPQAMEHFESVDKMMHALTIIHRHH